MFRAIAAYVGRHHLALLALFVALAGTSFAATGFPANVIGPKQLKRNAVTNAKLARGAVTGIKVKDNSLTGADVLEAKLAKVPAAAKADSATSAAPSGSAGGVLAGTYPNPSFRADEAWHEIGQPGEPSFQNGWVNYAPLGVETAAFYKDAFGIVHLKGYINLGTSAVAFTLPAAYRPTQEKFFPSANAATGTVAWIAIEPGGNVDAVGAGACCVQHSLDGITYRVG